MAITGDTLEKAGVPGFKESRPDALARRQSENMTRQSELGQQQVDISRQQEDLQRKKSEETAPLRDKLAAKAAETPSATAKEEPIPEYHRPQVDPNEFKDTFGTMMAAAMLTGVASRNPYNNAMSAMTGLMEGYQKQDTAMVNESIKTFNTNLNAIKEKNDQKRREVESAWKTYQHDVGGLKTQLELIAAKYDDPTAALAARAKTVNEAMKIIESNIKSADTAYYQSQSLAERAQAHADSMAERRSRDAETATYHRDMVDIKRHSAAGGGSGGGLDEKTVKMLAEKWMQGDSSALSGLGLGNSAAAARRQVLEKASELAEAQGKSGGDIAAAKSEYAANTSSLRQYQNYVNRLEGLAGKIDRDISTMFTTAEKGVGPSGVPAFDKWLQAGRRASGDPDVTAFDTAIQTIKNEYGRSMSGPASNAQLTVSALEHADELLNSAMTMDQIKAAVKIMRQEIRNQQDQTKEQLKQMRASLSGHAESSEHQSAGAYSDPEKERRYQEWKAKHAQ